MFKEMKRKFLLLNMVIITFLMVLSFTVIFIFMRSNITASISSDLVEIENHYQDYFYRKFSSYLGPNTNEKAYTNDFYFVADISKKSKIGLFSLDNGFDAVLKSELIVTSMDLTSKNGYFSRDGSIFAFKKTNIDDEYIRLIVLDVTNKIHVIDQLFLNLMIVGGVMTFFIFLISNFFTNKSLRPIEAAFNKQRQFISDASHELKTPLSVMKTNLDIVLNNKDTLVADQKKWLDYVGNEITGMSNLINQLLCLTKVEQIKEVDTFEKVNFSDIVNSVILSMEVIAFEKNIFVGEIISDDIYVVGNYDELKRLVMILFDNAIKYCNTGGKIVIELTNNHLLIGNTGTIINKDECEAVFQRFYRANKERERKSGSYGLGLSIASSTCEKHNFTIKAFPESDMTIFKVNFKSVANKGNILSKT